MQQTLWTKAQPGKMQEQVSIMCQPHENKTLFYTQTGAAECEVLDWVWQSWSNVTIL